MKKENLFYIAYILTILVIRIGVFLFPQRKIIIDGTIIHHFWIGVILVLIFLIIPKIYNSFRMILFSIGLGIITDELIFMILGGGTVQEYWSIYSVSGTIILAAITFVIRKEIVCDILY